MTTNDPFPEQDLSILTSPVSRRNIQRLSSLSDLYMDTYTISRLMDPRNPWALRPGATAEFAQWNRDLDFDGPQQRLAAFALICTRLLWTTRTSADADLLDSFVQVGGVRALLDGLPALARLPERLYYTDALIAYLRAALRWISAGELGWHAQDAFLNALTAELTRRRAAWKAALTARLPATREALVATVWHPRNMARWLNDATTETAREHLFNGFIVSAA
jgi:hypothetical protein